MAYNKTQWIAHETIVSADNLNKIEDGIFEAHEKIDKLGNIENKIQEAVEDAKEYTNEKVADLVGTAPETLDTLKELSDALGGDENFATTVSRQIGEKLGKTENAVSASKLETARNIALTGAVTGNVNFDGKKDVSITTKNRSCVCGQNTTPIGNKYWFKVASAEASANYYNSRITFNVVSTHGYPHSSGTLNIVCRRGNSVTYHETLQISWETCVGFDPENFVLAYNNDNEKVYYELWMKETSSSRTQRFTVIDEGGIGVSNTEQWTLHNNARSNLGVETPTEGYELLTSTLSYLKNNISGNASTATTATKLATARNIAITGDVIGSVNFNGDSDVSIKADAVGLVGSVVFRNNTQWLKICTFETSFNNATTPLTFSIRGRYNQSFSEEVSIKLKGGVYQTTDINSFVYTGEGKYAKNLKIVKPTESPRFELWLERVGSWDSITLSNISVHKGEITMTWNKQPTNTFPTEYVALHTPTADTSISEQIETLVEQRVDERLSTLTQLLVAKGILEADNPAVIPELE